jgi:hypothetical protein
MDKAAHSKFPVFFAIDEKNKVFMVHEGVKYCVASDLTSL